MNEVFKDYLKEFIEANSKDASEKSLINFLYQKSDNFSEEKKDLTGLCKDALVDKIYQIGRISLNSNGISNSFIVTTLHITKELAERTSKKQQFEVGKNIIKQLSQSTLRDLTGGFFIFYDDNLNYRWSLIYQEPTGRTVNYNPYKRYTYYISRDQTNKTFLQQLCVDTKFNSLEDIKSAFSVEKVTKEFYNEIAKWYFWAIKNCKFPKDAENEPNGRNISVIRLITRLIFIWFMKQRGLIPKELFDKKSLVNIIKDFNPEHDTQDNYYKAILQNLFFATLNTPQDKRHFRNQVRGHKGYNPDYGNHHTYRYENLFQNIEDTINKYFRTIPFLNGGLFECLDYKSKNNDERKYIDGFTDTKAYQPFVPNLLFFTDEETVDLSSDYNESNYRTTKVKGIIKTLDQYNFTIDENEPDDIEIALDPELLGKVFENLLASYNPETATTARKATGSYYTPREIVDYMVDESLKAYFLPHIQESDKENKLEKLFSKDESNNPFSPQTTGQLVNLIDSLRIVDPAVGSGVFPMRILSRLVFLLHKLDPKNELWKNIQIEGIRKSIKDPILQKELIKQVEERFFEKNPDYGRKLYLIEKCIYGVDIQQIAVEIAKLRFFISLLVDEKIDLDHPQDNYGIEPLPNLDFKLMQGNSLINSFQDIDFKTDIDNQLFQSKYDQLVSEFEELKGQYQNEPDIQQKRELREKIDEKITEIFEEKLNEHISQLRKIEEVPECVKGREIYIKNEKEKLFKKLGIDLEKLKKELIAYTEGRKEKDFFLWDVFFAEVFSEKGGFDIVIANPPYIQLQRDGGRLANLYSGCGYETFDRMGDIYCLFYEKGIDLLNPGGILAYISSNKWMRAGYGKKLRGFFTKYNPLQLIDLGPGVFENATVDTCILLIQKAENQNKLKAVTLEKEDKGDIKKALEERGVQLNNLTSKAWFIGSDAEQRLREKIERIGKTLEEWNVKIYRGILTGLNEAFIIDSQKREEILANCKDEEERKRTEAIIKPILRGRDIKRYYYQWAGLWMIGTFPALHLDIEDYPALKKYFLDNFDIRQLEQSGKKYPEIGFEARKKTGNKWFETQDQIAYYPEFEKEKVVWAEISYDSKFAFVGKGIYIDKTAFILLSEIRFTKYLCTVMNSKIFDWEFKQIGASLGQGYQWNKQYIELAHIPPITPENEPIVKQMETLVDKILVAKKQNPQTDTTELEREIDHLVYQLYDLTPNEIKIIKCRDE